MSYDVYLNIYIYIYIYAAYTHIRGLDPGRFLFISVSSHDFNSNKINLRVSHPIFRYME